ncbi:MAG TPA: hypothetical protein VLI06_04780 [Solimonas sp.]|nr:hypothetical protein [Solimonas sp.]
MNDMTSTAAKAGAVKSSFRQGIPSLVFALAVAGAAVYAFSHRPPPPFMPTQVYSDKIQVNGLARIGARMVGVGEQGRILISDDPKKGDWREAKVDKPRGSTLTQVLALEGALIAVGHDSWILRSEDRGETWKEVNFSTESSDPLLGVSGPYGHKLFAYGSFGLLMASEDGGKTWKRETLVEEGKAEPEPVPAADPNADPYADPYADPFANVGKGDTGIGDRHLNAMTKAPDGSLWLVGERGLLAQSTNGGQSWKAQPEIYAGSFFGILTLPSRAMLVYGMRGNAYYSGDQGQTWKKSKIPETLSLFGGATTLAREVVLVGASNAVFVSKDGGASFNRVSAAEQKGIAAVLPLDSGDIVTAGEGGIAVRELRAPSAAAPAGAQP